MLAATQAGSESERPRSEGTSGRPLRERAQGVLAARWLDESDCVGAWESAGMAAVLFPTGATLEAVRQLDRGGGGGRLLLAINPQWQPAGQVVSDFGCALLRPPFRRVVPHP